MILHTIRLLMCGVSMVLTALFAFTFSGLTLGNQASWSTLDWLAGLLLITLGVCIDSGKYLFWYHRKHSTALAALSLSLALFSWLASVAFFLAGEQILLTQKQQDSPEYASHRARIASLRQEIKDRQTLVNHRLSSRYHGQWQAGEHQLNIIAERQQELADLLRHNSQIGKAPTMDALPSQQLFASVATLLETDTHQVRVTLFGILALLIECCTLAVLSLVHFKKSNSNTNKPSISCGKSLSDKKERDKRARLIVDIVQGNVEPVLRKIKVSGYGLPLEDVKTILVQLHRQGILEEASRNSYELSDFQLK